MIHRLAPLALVALALPLSGGIGAAPVSGEPSLLAQFTLHERIIIRVPKLHQGMPPSQMPIPTPPRWKEKKGPACIAATDLAGAMISRPGAVDLILVGGDHVRAVLDDDCGPLDFYGGYYIRPAPDGKICGKRDMIRVRSGGRCGIDRFRRLVPAR
jgi:hypothetical protein